MKKIYILYLLLSLAGLRSVQAQDSVKEKDKADESIISIYGGVSVPLGDFADKNNGGAKSGITAGLQYVSGGRIGGVLNLSFTANPCDMSEALSLYGGKGTYGDWHALGAFIGLKVVVVNSSGMNIFAAPLLGMNICTTPKVKYIIDDPVNGSKSFEMKTAIATAFTYGFMSEISIGHIILGMRYIAFKPKFTVETIIENSLQPNPDFTKLAVHVEQSTSLFLLYLAFGF
jgi:hypothetical protein